MSEQRRKPRRGVRPRERSDQFVHHIVDIDQMQLHRRVVHRDRQIVGDIVAEGRNGRVIIRTAPFAEKIRKTVNQYFRAGLFGIVEQQLLAGTFGLAVRIVQSRLNRRRNHHRAGIAMFFQRGEKRRREPEIASHKLRRVLRTVDTREVEDEIRIPAIGIEFFRRTVQIVFIERKVS